MDIESQGFEGLIGLGPNTGSTILDKVDDDSGNRVLDRVFSQNTTSANYLTILLDRIGDTADNAASDGTSLGFRRRCGVDGQDGGR